MRVPSTGVQSFPFSPHQPCWSDRCHVLRVRIKKINKKTGVFMLLTALTEHTTSMLPLTITHSMLDLWLRVEHWHFTTRCLHELTVKNGLIFECCRAEVRD